MIIELYTLEMRYETMLERLANEYTNRRSSNVVNICPSSGDDGGLYRRKSQEILVGCNDNFNNNNAED